jgi:hypothetical protein
LNTAFICVCISFLRSEGLLNARPTSFDGTETFIPPKAVSWGVWGSFKKLNTELPPIVCANRDEERRTDNIIIIRRKELS